MTKDEFEERVLVLERTLYCVARTYLLQPADCADCVQEAILKAWRNQSSLRETQYFKTWLVRILINECLHVLRTQKRVIPVERIADSPAPQNAEGEVYALLMSLPEKYRVPTVLHYVGGYSLEEIAQTLKLPLGTVKNHLFRAREKLKLTIQEEALSV